ncbi:MAG: hypothetical protein JO060_02580 [Candidatus Eremiobacteraeota bacterium]|nr:hypothetical protein [Candidatus Eremiobacteraeota bacterium]
MVIERVAVIGAGTMGTGIAMAVANSGLPVHVSDESAQALERGRATIARTYDGAVARGRLQQEEKLRRLERIAFDADDQRVLGRVDLVIEAAFEDLSVKQGVFERLGRACRQDAVLATNTSTLDVDAIARAAPHAERSLGLHFFSPAHVMRLLEVVRGSGTAAETIDAALDFARHIGKLPVVVGNGDGFVGNRMLLHYRREAELALERGATPAQVDRALVAFGFAMGPFAVADLAGVDVGWRAKQERNKRGGLPFRVSEIPDRLVEAGRLGQKTGAGYYRYDGGKRTPIPDPLVDDVLAQERSRIGIAPHAPSDDEIVARCLCALINEGARILDDRIASSPSDIDTIWRTGYGFPAERGGPMAYADATGLERVLAAVHRFAEDDPAFWRPAPLLEKLARGGQRFSSLNASGS